MPLRHWLQLSLTRGLGPILTRRIIQLTGSAEAACSAGLTLLREVEGVGRIKADAIASSLRSAAGLVDAELAKADAAGATVVCPDDVDAYPLLLRSIPDPPLVLYLRGAFEDRDLHAVAIVGSRKCSGYGREQAERFGSLLAGAGVTVISGGARGIDSAAHRGALAQPNGRTVAVLGSGVDVTYPPENKALFEQVSRAGVVVSEYPMGTTPTPENFPRRNRIVSGMSRGVIVIEADERSGALITARQACDDHGRPVFAVPGRVDNPLSRGPHQLLRDGACLCAGLEDVLDNLGPLPIDATEATIAAATRESPMPLPAATFAAAAAAPTVVAPSLFPTATTVAAPPARPAAASPAAAVTSPRQRAILDALADGPANVDALTEQTLLPAHEILQELTFLTLRGQVKRVDGHTYAVRK